MKTDCLEKEGETGKGRSGDSVEEKKVLQFTYQSKDVKERI